MRKIILALFVAVTIILFIVLLCNKAIENASSGKLYDKTELIPYNKVCILLGTAKYIANGRQNPYYDYRIIAAANLLKSGKCRYIIISGDNGRSDYNEPEDMRKDLIETGIDSTIIFLDYAGFRTFDSMIRLRDVFGQKEVTVISQPFHNQRAIYIASQEGISAIGFNAADVSKKFGFKIMLREKFARVKVFIDLISRKKPKFLGKKINLPS